MALVSLLLHFILKSAHFFPQAMSRYDYGIINIQKDFYFHDTLCEYDNHPFRTEFSGYYLLSGSGLSTFSKYSWIDFFTVGWNSCSIDYGYDCFALKGFTFMRVRIDEGVYIDMINLHTNAGIRRSEEAARRSNIRQVADYISANSAGNAVVVFGNTNSRYTRYEDNLDFLIGQNGLTDAWVQAIGGIMPIAGSDALICPRIVPLSIECEVVDKVFYRGSPAIHLNSMGFFYDTARFLSPENSMLSDHHPVRVEFRYELKYGIRQSSLYGGPHGTWFNDISSIDSLSKLSFIALCGVGQLEGLILKFESSSMFTHGSTAGSCYPLNLGPKDYITSVKLCWDKMFAHTRISYAQVTTNTRKLRHAGMVTNDCAVANAPVGYGVAGTYGQVGRDLNQLGSIYQLGFIYTLQKAQ
ncbi:endonuclease/exonuclease/phosphatase family protein [Rhizoctonia solani 123E]|uniref:Endonuclease/exonuclease/phosphatase family protein n=1 Tax=Rhizoctonia solani 123E TaxID=1423351 RepID=A0A074RK99_9AGAM|nr:endonuclease/exonuclease/phosphatase family protein [Rhizoctonia solani 123E]